MFDGTSYRPVVTVVEQCSVDERRNMYECVCRLNGVILIQEDVRVEQQRPLSVKVGCGMVD